MADTALARLRGILAAHMTGTAIEQLLAEVLAEHDAAEQPTPCALTEPAERPRWTDTSTYSGFARTCLICPFETQHWDRPGQAAGEMELHLANVHGRGSTQHGVITVHLDQRTVDSVLLDPIRAELKRGRRA